MVSPKGLKPKKDHEIRAPKPMKEKKEKKRDPDQKMEEEVKELSRDPQRLPKSRYVLPSIRDPARKREKSLE